MQCQYRGANNAPEKDNIIKSEINSNRKDYLYPQFESNE